VLSGKKILNETKNHNPYRQTDTNLRILLLFFFLQLQVYHYGGMTSQEWFENKWFYTKYIGKYLSVEMPCVQYTYH
jgi:hypothetical protein